MKQLLTALILCALPLGAQTVESGYRDIPEITAPGNPAADHARWYAKDDTGTTKLCYKDSAGTETCVGAGGGSSTYEMYKQTFWFGNDTDGVQTNLLGADLQGHGVDRNATTAQLIEGSIIFGDVVGEELFVHMGDIPSGYDLTAVNIEMVWFSDINASTNAHVIDVSVACLAEGDAGNTDATGLTYTTAFPITFTPAATSYAKVTNSGTHDASGQCAAGESMIMQIERDNTDAATAPVYLYYLRVWLDPV